MSDYQDFLAHKARKADLRGLKQVPLLREHLFAFQAHCVAHALRAGCAGIFLDTGLGKTELQLEWCQHALEASNGKALILTPLAVAQQTRKRAEKWGYEARVIAGIGSEGVMSLKLRRKFMGTELKEGYFRQACRYLEAQDNQDDLFDRELLTA
jgi:CRISPR/Cas system-associated endonuclease/helicase Cas3